MTQELTALGLDFKTSNAELKRAAAKKKAIPKRREEEEVRPPREPRKTYPRQETALLELLIEHYNDVHPVIHDFLPSHLLTDPTCRKVIEELMLDPPSILREQFHELDPHTQNLLTRNDEVMRDAKTESRTIGDDSSPVEVAQRYIMIFWKRFLERAAVTLTRRSDVSGEERYQEQTRLKHDLHALAKGWAEAQPMLEARLHKDVEF